MAHPILATPRLFAVVLICVVASSSVFGRTTERQSAECSSDSLTGAPESRQKEAAEFRQRVEASPFYSAVVQQAGKAQSCRMELAAQNLSISYKFPGDASLEATIDPSIEYSNQRLQLGGISSKKAVALLKEEEADSFGHSGCGIRWNHPTRQSSGVGGRIVEVGYRGDVCNCQARVVYDGSSVVALVLSSTC
jgi:hypothetical protein